MIPFETKSGQLVHLSFDWNLSKTISVLPFPKDISREIREQALFAPFHPVQSEKKESRFDFPR
jgi:hypothetical protein